MAVTVYGSSDDLVEVEGDVEEEFSGPGDGPFYLAFSDGTILSIIYGDESIWRIAPVRRGAAKLTVEQAARGDEDNYSDRATLDGVAIASVVFGSDFGLAKE